MLIIKIVIYNRKTKIYKNISKKLINYKYNNFNVMRVKWTR